MVTLLNEHDIFNLIKDNACFRGESSCLDLNLANQKYSLKNSTSFETELSNHHHSIYSILKTASRKEESKMLIYCNYETFSLERPSSELSLKFGSQESNEHFMETFIRQKSGIFFMVTMVTRELILVRNYGVLLWNAPNQPTCSQCILSLPLESGNRWVFLLFHGLEKGCIGNKWVKKAKQTNVVWCNEVQERKKFGS